MVTLLTHISRIASLAVVAALVIAPAKAEDSAELGRQMLSSLRLTDSKTERNGTFDEVIAALKRGGYIHRRRDAKKDYAAIWKLLKPIDVYGNRVLVVSNEEAGAYIGCCMEDRTKILMEANGDISGLREFAKQNRCLLDYDDPSEQESLKQELADLKIKSKASKLLQLSCSNQQL